MKTRTKRTKSSARQLAMSILFVLCAFFMSAGLQPLLSPDRVSQGHRDNSVSIEHAKVDGQVAASEDTPSNKSFAASILAVILNP